MTNIIHDLTDSSSKYMVYQKERLISNEIAHILGVESVNFNDLIDRVECIRYVHSDVETWFFDGKLILEIYPIAYDLEDGHITASFQYRRFK